ncbi:hypothetical protein F5Y02DRAFT_397345 [Annulohypoxylon stygium]|nr:hypothetical protein F5Y02DRAFT_397345 [Annulohypoxylon stygium]
MEDGFRCGLLLIVRHGVILLGFACAVEIDWEEYNIGYTQSEPDGNFIIIIAGIVRRNHAAVGCVSDNHAITTEIRLGLHDIHLRHIIYSRNSFISVHNLAMAAVGVKPDCLYHNRSIQSTL